MKKIIFAISFLFTVNAFAIAPEVFELQDGDKFLEPMAGTHRIVGLAPSCPAGAACFASTVVDITFDLGGCLDRAAVNHKVQYVDGVYHVYVSALRVMNELSLAALCVARPLHVERIFVGPGVLGEGEVKVHYLGVPNPDLPVIQ